MITSNSYSDTGWVLGWTSARQPIPVDQSKIEGCHPDHIHTPKTFQDTQVGRYQAKNRFKSMGYKPQKERSLTKERSHHTISYNEYKCLQCLILSQRPLHSIKSSSKDTGYTEKPFLSSSENPQIPIVFCFDLTFSHPFDALLSLLSRFPIQLTFIFLVLRRVYKSLEFYTDMNFNA